MNDTPLVSVLLPAYNAEMYIYDAIKSILLQTYSNFEFIIINDGSVDNTKNIILSFSDSRIKYFENEKNSGLIYTLNRGLKLAKGKYIARMDADDISLPTRLEKQVEVMEENPAIVVCGGQVEMFGDVSRRIGKSVKLLHDKNIKESMFISCPFAHPTVLIRKSVLDVYAINYDANFKDAEDYKLWFDLYDKGKFVNIEEVVLQYRVSSTQITQRDNSLQQVSANKVRRMYLLKNYPNLRFSGPITYDVYKDSTKVVSNKYARTLILLSLDTYRLRDFLHFICSLGWIKMSPISISRLFKRFVLGPKPLI